MPEAPLLPESPLQRQIAQMALELAAELERQAQQAPRGGTLDACEALLLGHGRQSLRDSLAAALQQQIDRGEKKGGPPAPVPADTPCRNKGAGSREFLTAIGPVRLLRTRFHCPACRLGGYAADELIGLDGRLSERAERMATLAGVHQSFRRGCSLLEGLAGWSACHEIIRQADELARQRQAASPEVEPFRQAQGQMESQTDATKLDTLGGWRDMKIGIFVMRRAGKPATAQEWDSRALPGPEARAAFAAVSEIETFAPLWWQWAERLGLGQRRPSVLGDGAGWIWEHAGMQLPYWQGVLAVFHGWLSKAAKAGCGEGTAQAALWLKEARLALLSDGYVGLCGYVQASAAWVPDRAGLEAAAAGVLGYFCGRRDLLNYALRLRQGLPIGSGLIEGACEQMIGRRMKQTGAQWDVDNANRMALLCSLAYADALPLCFAAA